MMVPRHCTVSPTLLAVCTCVRGGEKLGVTIEPDPGRSISKELETRLGKAVSETQAVRTLHLREDGSPRWTNRLALETSPYRLQHAHNPVDWRALGRRRVRDRARLDRPIFLSIGYATRHCAT